MDNATIGKATKAVIDMMDRMRELADEVTFVRDQCGVVWFWSDGGLFGAMSADTYNRMRDGNAGLIPYEDLEFWDSHQQNIVDVD